MANNEPVRQRYQIATGGGPKTSPPRTEGTPGFKKGGTVRKQAGGAMYKRGGKTGC